MSDAVCKDNPSEGVSSIPLEGLRGTPAGAATSARGASTSAMATLYMGEYACYGVGSRLMAGMGFVLRTDGKYADVDGARGGSYQYDAAAATIAFRGGFLGSQVGKNVKSSGFAISATVTCEPWR